MLYALNRFLNVKAVVTAFNQEKALAFYVIVKPMDRFTALISRAGWMISTCLRRQVDLDERLELPVHGHQLGPAARARARLGVEEGAYEGALGLLALHLGHRVPAVEGGDVGEPRHEVLPPGHRVLAPGAEGIQ